MNMKKRHHRQRQGGFSISEVVLAVGVVAFGLVAVLGVLPAGLSVHKDNREETVIRYEARYWINALRAGAQQFDALNQVEWAEIRVDDGGTEKVYRAHRNRLGGDAYPNSSRALYWGHLKQIYWPTDVIGWLSIPNGTVKTKTVLVRPLNSTLFDRIYGRKLLVTDRSSYDAKGSTIYHPLAGGDLAFAYLLEVSIKDISEEVDPDYVEGVVVPFFHKVKLTFRWPVLDDPTIEDPSKDASDVKTISKMVFETDIAGTLEAALIVNPQILVPSKVGEVPGSFDYNGTRRKRFAAEQILSIVLPGDGEDVTVDELEAVMPAPRLTSAGPVLRLNDDYYIQTDEIGSVLAKLAGQYGIMEEMTGSLALADQIWSMRRQPYSGYGHYSMRPMTGTSNGGYEPMWSAGAGNRFNGFQPPPLPPPSYFNQQYFFTPDNQ